MRLRGEHKGTLTGHARGVLSVAFSQDGKTLASGSWDQTVWLWDTVTWTHKRVFRGHRYKVLSLSFSPDGSVLASASGNVEDKMVHLWDAVTV